MAELFTGAELQAMLREDVAAAGGAKKWLRKHKVSGCDHILHMVANGDAATLDDILRVLGFTRVVRYEPVPNRLVLAKPTKPREFVWRPADVVTTGVASIATRGTGDGPLDPLAYIPPWLRGKVPEAVPSASPEAEAERWERCFKHAAQLVMTNGMVTAWGHDRVPYKWDYAGVEFTRFSTSEAGPYDTLMWREKGLVAYFRPDKPPGHMGFMKRVDIRTVKPEALGQALGQALGHLRQRAGVVEEPK